MKVMMGTEKLGEREHFAGAGADIGWELQI